MRGMEKIVSCELSFIPIESQDYRSDVKKVIDIISGTGIYYEVSAFSTTVTGHKDVIFGMIEKIYSEMENDAKFTIVIKISNVCGCDI